VFCGQLSIGWSNDRLDAFRDAEVGRYDKPLATGALDPRWVDVAIGCTVVATVVLSFQLGAPACLLHLAAVACGWIYNLAAKSSWLSWLPYAVAFGALPGVATLALPGQQAPAGWLVGAGACLGVVANLANALPDLTDDERTGVRGAPHRIGAAGCVVSSSGLLFVSTVLIVFGPHHAPGSAGYAGLGIAAVLALAGCGWGLGHPRTRAIFVGLFAFVALELALVAVVSHHLQ
jgi:4-hydroxybenzoate polyprenyltransferase